MDSPRLDRALRFKNNAMRGGVIEHVYMKDVEVGQVADSILSVDFFYEEGDKGPFTPVARDIEMLRVTSKKSPYALYLRGFPNAPVEDVRIVQCHFANVDKRNVLENVKDVSFDRTTNNGKEAKCPPASSSAKLLHHSSS